MGGQVRSQRIRDDALHRQEVALPSKEQLGHGREHFATQSQNVVVDAGGRVYSQSLDDHVEIAFLGVRFEQREHVVGVGERLDPSPDDGGLRREVVEERLFGYLGAGADGFHGDRVISVLEHEFQRRAFNREARLELLAVAQPFLRRLCHAGCNLPSNQPARLRTPHAASADAAPFARAGRRLRLALGEGPHAARSVRRPLLCRFRAAYHSFIRCIFILGVNYTNWTRDASA